MLTITNSAKDKFLEILEEKKNILGVRVSIDTWGCGGHKYVLDFCDKLYDRDWVYWVEGVRFVIRDEFRAILEGLLIDWSENDLGGRWVYTNPVEKDRCGCGRSFSI